jgi:Mg/Co/Ni transporter MgtE
MDGEAGARAEDVMDRAPGTFPPDLPADRLREWFSSHDRTSASVTTREGKLLGVLTSRRLDAAVPVAAGRN